ncbi:MAG: MBL fold metallo-hydrolase [Pseudomonadota bacterium]|nr:MBL fold metallo-hydrolase [Pseudomonadota bacterium]
MPATVTHTQGLPPGMQVLERGWLSSTNLLCLGDAPALIDTGHLKHASQTLALVRNALHRAPGTATLADVAHTHLHSDHCGGTAALQTAWPQARTWVPAPSLPHVQSWDETQLSFARTAQRCARFSASHALRHGHTVALGDFDWQVHAAPGHDALAVLLFEPRHGVLVAGDALWEHSVGVIFPHIDGGGNDSFAHFTDTLALIERLDPAILVPGHGAPFWRAEGAIAAALQRARQRMAHFQAHPAAHALYAAKVLVKYQMLDAERMTHASFSQWLHSVPHLHTLHRQHRPDLPWAAWLNEVLLAPMFSKGVLQRDATHVRDGD